MENLWPESLQNIEPIKTPKNILDEQAQLLSKITKDMIYAYTVSEDPEAYFDIITYDKQIEFCYSFNIKGKFLEHYNFNALTIAHEIVSYPLLMTIEEGISQEIGSSSAYNIEVKDEEDFKEKLKLILASTRLRNVLESILSLSK